MYDIYMHNLIYPGWLLYHFSPLFFFHHLFPEFGRGAFAPAGTCICYIHTGCCTRNMERESRILFKAALRITPIDQQDGHFRSKYHTIIYTPALNERHGSLT